MPFSREPPNRAPAGASTPSLRGASTLDRSLRFGSNEGVGAAWYKAKGELRRRWRATLLLVLLVG
ncbi:MAG: hypothetical protein WKF86_08085, partial [Acidimicrobiales bacterium]